MVYFVEKRTKDNHLQGILNLRRLFVLKDILGLTWGAKDASRWLHVTDRVEATDALAHRIVTHLNTKGVLVVVDARLIVETLIA